MVGVEEVGMGWEMVYVYSLECGEQYGVFFMFLGWILSEIAVFCFTLPSTQNAQLMAITSSTGNVKYNRNKYSPTIYKMI